MRKRDYNKKYMFRDFLHKDREITQRNPLKNLKLIKKEFCKKNNISFAHLEFLFWAYDLEFFTIHHAAKSNEMSYGGTADRYIYPLKSAGLLYKYFDKLTKPRIENQLFRDETKFNYRVRYSLTQKGINMVNRFYKEIGIHLP